MKITRSSTIQSFILAAALGIGLGFVSPVSAQVQHAYLVDSNGKGVTDLGTLADGGDSRALGINDAGQVVGESETFLGRHHAFVTGPNGVGMHGLRDLGGHYSQANGINDAGQVVGESATPFDQLAFITGPNGVGMTGLSFLGYPYDNFGEAFGINASGQVAGFSNTAASARRAFITGPNGVGMTDLGTLPGYTESSAQGINDAGQVVGYSTTATGTAHAFITGPNGVGMTDLGTLGGGDSFASGINDAGQVVGYSITAAGAAHAFITGPNGVGMSDLNTLVSLPSGVVLRAATEINNHGQVAAVGSIPEPETYAMLLAGLGLLGFIARRRKTA